MQCGLRRDRRGYCPGTCRYRGCARPDPVSASWVKDEIGVFDVGENDVEIIFRDLTRVD